MEGSSTSHRDYITELKEQIDALLLRVRELELDLLDERAAAERGWATAESVTQELESYRNAYSPPPPDAVAAYDWYEEKEEEADLRLAYSPCPDHREEFE